MQLHSTYHSYQTRLSWAVLGKVKGYAADAIYSNPFKLGSLHYCTVHSSQTSLSWVGLEQAGNGAFLVHIVPTENQRVHSHLFLSFLKPTHTFPSPSNTSLIYHNTPLSQSFLQAGHLSIIIIIAAKWSCGCYSRFQSFPAYQWYHLTCLMLHYVTRDRYLPLYKDW